MTTRVAICALTYLRPTGLRQLLAGIERLAIPTGVSARVFIVDNDPSRSAEPLIEEVEAGPDGRGLWPGPPITYRSEPARGISHARNAAVQEAADWGADWICFIDDDEWPDPSWLAEFLATAEQTGAAIVSGPVEPVFEQAPPAWITDGGFFECRRHDHNQPMHYATTSSVLIRREVLDDVPGPFDPVFGMSGGEDTHLFAQLRERGHSLVWSDRAVVYETIPPSRATSEWLLKRELRRGQTLGLSLRHRDASALRLARRGAKGLVELVAGAVGAAANSWRGRARWFVGVRRCAFGIGILTGLLGRQHQEYAVIHGG